MIESLKIQNYALIDQLEIDLSPGLNTITGETGAGKSILLGALSMLLGQRADTSVLKDKERNCVVEAEFDIEGYNLQGLFAQHDIEYDHHTTIRRTISSTGKSRTFVNDTPVNLATLKELCDNIIDIHSQHQNLLLGSSQFQLRVLDAMAGTKQLLAEYGPLYQQYRKAMSALQAAEAEVQTASADLDYAQHQLSELQAAALRPGELEELEEQQAQLTHAGEIKTTMQLCANGLHQEPNSAIATIKHLQALLKRCEPYLPTAASMAQRLESCRIELKDIADEASALSDRIDMDEAALSRTAIRLDQLYTLLQKHRTQTIDELIALRDDLQQRVLHLQQLDFDIEQQRQQVAELRGQTQRLAQALSQQRQAAAPTLQRNVSALLEQLGIPHASFEVRMAPLPELHPRGTDHVGFLFSANKQMPPQELARVASGGELARLMLSLKHILAQSSGLGTIIFDEIDTGVSGEIADRMGSIIASISEQIQVINITHLPQIAAKGRTHFAVYKDHSQAQSTTRIRRLEGDDRVMEIAQMLSGQDITKAAIENARELLSQ
ncbi:MAG: DNA repair protein RecN [Bacteroidales bacterium]|nr:DNA repair protein RecN [Bacteroidales bacterium]